MNRTLMTCCAAAAALSVAGPACGQTSMGAPEPQEAAAVASAPVLTGNVRRERGVAFQAWWTWTLEAPGRARAVVIAVPDVDAISMRFRVRPSQEYVVVSGEEDRTTAAPRRGVEQRHELVLQFTPGTAPTASVAIELRVSERTQSAQVLRVRDPSVPEPKPNPQDLTTPARRR